jgi:type I restriction enzyme, S subunit
VSAIPNTWVSVALGEINQFSGRSIDPQSTPDTEYELYSVPIFPTGRPELLRGSAIGSTKQTVAPGDVLVCKINPRINRVWSVGPRQTRPQIASSEWIAVRAPSFDSRYLRYFFSSPAFRREIEEGVTGVGGSLTRAQPKRVATFAVPIAPIPEQTRIANKIEALLTGVNNCSERLHRVPQILKKFREAVLEAAVSGRMTEEWRARTDDGDIDDELSRIDAVRTSLWGSHNRGAPKTPADPLRPFIESLPPNWRWVSLDRLALLVVDGTHFTPTYVADGVPFVSVKDIRGEAIHLDNCKYISAAEHKELSKRCHAQKGDLLVTKSGTIGRVAIVGDEGEFSLFVSVALVKPVRDLVSTAYLSLAFRAWLNSIDIASEITGTGVKNLHIRDLRRVPIALPTLEEQHQIVHRVDQIVKQESRLKRRYETIASSIETLTPSVLAKAFRGELVPQDLNDEPGGKVLERMRLAKKAGEGSPRVASRAPRDKVGSVTQQKRRA